MASYLIEGGNRLFGSVSISGNKNSILPCMAAALLTSDEVILRNVPQISDVSIMVLLMQQLGAEVEVGDHFLKITTPNIKTSKLSEDLVNKLRASILLAGPLLARSKKVEFSHPGGDIIGQRSIETHLAGFKQLGFSISVSDRDYKIKGGIDSKEKIFFMDEPSVTATENLILTCSLNEGKIILKNCASEPHIVDLCNLLKKMGVKFSGIGTNNLTIEGAKKLSGAEFSVGSDFVEFGTYVVAAAITKGEIKLYNCPLENLEPITHPLKKMGVKFQENSDGSVSVSSQNLVAIPKLITNIWPGFPTDLMSALIVLATQAKGVSLMHDWMYESRMFFVDKLINMGANITISDPHRVLVYGPTKLHARELETPDIRAGMALVLAALVAKGTSVINRAELIERGYEDVTNNLAKLGAKIQKLDAS
ncbi:UDP-N-acetylglucosamine 1-carboxyvinyltransferase [Candidatus Daviesbacteria bacterium]|nr:UDP-N-acetylglucosamine 1-carboxyvinyltransferase [Candidatus Daviesbacteria bacterium]